MERPVAGRTAVFLLLLGSVRLKGFVDGIQQSVYAASVDAEIAVAHATRAANIEDTAPVGPRLHGHLHVVLKDQGHAVHRFGAAPGRRVGKAECGGVQ